MRRRQTTAALVGAAVLVTTIAARQAPQRPSAFAPKPPLPPAASQPWPMGAGPPKDAAPTGIDRARVDKALDLAFSDPQGLTAAVVIVHKGQIVGERYMPGISKDTQLESWLM